MGNSCLLNLTQFLKSGIKLNIVPLITCSSITFVLDLPFITETSKIQALQNYDIIKHNLYDLMLKL